MAIDTSSRLSQLDFDRIKEFTKASLESYTPRGKSETARNRQIVLLSYGDDSVTEVKPSPKTPFDWDTTFKLFPRTTKETNGGGDGTQDIEQLLKYANKLVFRDENPTQKKLLILTVFGKRPSLKDLSPRIVTELREKKGVEIVVLAIGAGDNLDQFKAICPPSSVVPIESSDQLPNAIGSLEGKARTLIGNEINRMFYFFIWN